MAKLDIDLTTRRVFFDILGSYDSNNATLGVIGKVPEAFQSELNAMFAGNALEQFFSPIESLCMTLREMQRDGVVLTKNGITQSIQSENIPALADAMMRNFHKSVMDSDVGQLLAHSTLESETRYQRQLQEVQARKW